MLIEDVGHVNSSEIEYEFIAAFGSGIDIPFVSELDPYNRIQSIRAYAVEGVVKRTVLVLKTNEILIDNGSLGRALTLIGLSNFHLLYYEKFCVINDEDLNEIKCMLKRSDYSYMHRKLAGPEAILSLLTNAYGSLNEATNNDSAESSKVGIDSELKGKEELQGNVQISNPNDNHNLDVSPKTIELLKPSSLHTLEELIKSEEKDTAKRLKTILTRIEKEPYDRKDLSVVPDITILDNVLEPKFPNFKEFFDFLRKQFILAKVGDGVFKLPPILLIGEPGVGKTEIMFRISEMIGSSFLVQDMASAQAGASLTGSDIYWSNSRHGELFNSLMFGKTANPIVLLDEIDKMSTQDQHSPAGGFYSLLERRTASQFNDLSMPGVFIDASHVIWVAAANDKSGIEPALLSRFKVFEIPSPNKEQMPAVIKSIYSDLLDRETWGNSFSRMLSDDLLNSLGSIAPRELRQILETACANAASSNRRHIEAEDIQVSRDSKRMGFIH